MRLEAVSKIFPYPRTKEAEKTAEHAEELGSRIGRKVAETKLEAIDGAVRAHEAAHVAALGTAGAGGASFSYMIGPDGTRYAVGGSVRVTASPVPGDPEATIRRAKALILASYAVISPSSADMRVAAEAYQMEMQAKRELAREVEAGEEAGVEQEWFA
jgi:hypothetical protein